MTKKSNLYSGNIIDVHAHIYPSKYLKELEKRKEFPTIEMDSAPGRGYIRFSETIRAPFSNSFHDLDARIKEMDHFQVTTQLLSAINPWTDSFPSVALAVSFSRLINNEIASIVSKYKNSNRFIGLATLPLLSPTDAAKELERSIDELGLVGAILGTNVSGTYISDDRFLPIFEVAQKKKCLLFLHPTVPLGAERLRENGLIRSLGYVFDSTLCLVKMAYSGLFDKFPNLKILSAHLSGTLPFVQGRVDTAWRNFEESKGKLSEPPSEKIKRVLYADTISYNAKALRLAAEFLGIERLMFGTDFPFEWGMDSARNSVDGAFEDWEQKLVYSENYHACQKSLAS
jgi:predicted TIM-barrel fold metal-dependent hydrolase